MDTPNYAGSVATYRKLFRNAHVSERELETLVTLTSPEVLAGAKIFNDGGLEPPLPTAEGINRLFEAVEKGDSATADTLLRSWGIR